ncbi:MAG: LysR family transcriptional regulator, partial [Chloroflexi bacterium]
MHVKGLEQFYSAKLLERHGRRLRPTEAGDLVAGYTRRILGLTDELARAVADLEGLRAGRLTIGASSTVGEQLLPAVLGRFHRAYPSVALSLRIGNTGEITSDVVERVL